MKSALERGGGSKWGVNFFSMKSAVEIFFAFFSMKSAVENFFSMKSAVENFFSMKSKVENVFSMKSAMEIFFNFFSMKEKFFDFFSLKSAVELFSSSFCSKSLKTKNFTPDGPTDFGDFSFFALSLIECKRQITCYVGGGGMFF
jgi:hypothetical protein